MQNAQSSTSKRRTATGRRPPKRRMQNLDIRPQNAAQIDAIRRTELIGCDAEGYMSLWCVGDVRPISKLPLSQGGYWIKDGHYVINWRDHAITVHLGNLSDGSVSVLFMCSALYSIPMRRDEIEALLLGEVVPDPGEKAEIRAIFERIAEALKAKRAAPHKQRGRIL